MPELTQADIDNICKQERQRVRKALLGDEAIEALRLELVGGACWDEANARARTGNRPGDKPTEREMARARRDIHAELRPALLAALDTLEDPDG